MKKKKIILLSAIAVLVLAAAAVMGTLAYFTAEETAHNVITTGGVDVALNEWAETGSGEKTPFEDVTGVMPGVVVSKIAEAENIGASAAWVRMRADVSILLAEGREGEVDLSLVRIDFNTDDWTRQDGWYYYNRPLEPGEVSAALFTEVAFDAQMGNLYQDSTAFVDVQLQAVQTANNGAAALEAAGWPEDET